MMRELRRDLRDSVGVEAAGSLISAPKPQGSNAETVPISGRLLFRAQFEGGEALEATPAFSVGWLESAVRERRWWFIWPFST